MWLRFSSQYELDLSCFFRQEEMNGWLEAVANSVAEHAEIARWGQTLPTTSSTDEGNPKREGGERRASGRRK